MAKRNIFIEKQIECPVCKNRVPLRYVNPKLYVAASRESDMHVFSYRWSDDITDPVPPHYYSVWQCPRCLFADLADQIENPSGSLKDDHLHEAYLKSDKEQRAALVELRKLVSEGELGFNGAAAQHLAALIITQMPDSDSVNHNRLGRIALRLGWLFREQGGGGKAVDIGEDSLAGMQEDVEKLQSLLGEAGSVLADLRLKAEERIQGDEDGDTSYAGMAGSMRDKLEDVRTLLSTLQGAIIHDLDSSAPGSPGVSKTGPASLTELLYTLRSRWAELPRNEEECLRVAVKAFDYSYSNETAYKSIEQGIKVVMLIIDLLCRVGEQEEALRYISEVYKSGMRNISDLSARIRDGKKNKAMTPYDERMLRRKIGNIQFSIRQAGEIRRDLLEKLTKHYKATIDKALAKVTDNPVKDQEKALLEAGIPEEIIGDLKARKVIKEPKKKGLFGR
ncbi:MAG TPA: DUF2225 domain-containing protein [Acidobacteriota bacterium]|nr:DUF2225 domain-containing protein [Acidobacteriota bacterium]